MKRFFSRKLYQEALSQLRLPGFLTSSALLAFAFLVPLTKRLSMPHSELVSWGFGGVTEFLTLFYLYLLFVPTLLSIVAFGFLNSRKKSDYYHALPVRRSSLFGSFAAAVFTWLIGTSIVAGLVYGGLYTVFGVPNAFSGFPLVLALLVTALLFAASATMLAMSITGTTFTGLVVTALIIWLPKLLSVLFQSGVTDSLPVLPSQEAGLFGLHIKNSYYSLFGILGYPDGLEGAGALASTVFTGALALLLLATACWLFVKRSSETAGSSAPGKKIQMIYRIAVALLSLMLLNSISALLYTGALIMVVTTITLSLLALCTFELISTKRWRNLWYTLPAFGIALVLSLAFTTLIWGVARYEASFTPSADQIAWVRIIDPKDWSENAIEYYSLTTTQRLTLKQSARSRTRFDSVEVRNTCATDLAQNTRKPVWGARSIWSMDNNGYSDESYYDKNYGANWYGYEKIIVEIHTTDGSVKKRLIPIACLGDGDYATLTPFGKALLAQVK